MHVHDIVSIVVCATALAFSLVVWHERTHSSLGSLLSLLFLDIFGWNFAELARAATGNERWHQVDRFFSTLMPGIALHLVIRFIGKDRAWRIGVLVQYASCLLLAVAQPKPYWWLYLFVFACLAMVTALVLLWRHRQRNVDPEERERASLILIAICVATVLGATDLWQHESPLDLPALGNLGMLMAIALVWIATMRSRLLNQAIPTRLISYAGVAGALIVFCYWAAVRWLDPQHGLWGAIGLTTLVVGLATWREFHRYWTAQRERAQRLALLGRLSEQWAHDVRNPLAAMKGAIQFLLGERQAGRTLDAQAEFLDLLFEQVERLERTVEHYQRLAKVTPELQPSSVNQIVERTTKLQRFGWTAPIELSLELEDGLPHCELDPDLFTLALENLLRNAGEALPHGGSIVVRTRRLDPPHAALLLQVQDNGPGIDARTLERVTDEFYTTKPHGTGLGLAFTRRVAQVHGGELRLRSVPGQGTTASIYLPWPETR